MPHQQPISCPASRPTRPQSKKGHAQTPGPDRYLRIQLQAGRSEVQGTPGTLRECQGSDMKEESVWPCEDDKPGLYRQTAPSSPALWCWAGYLTSLCLHLLICKMGIQAPDCRCGTVDAEQGLAPILDAGHHHHIRMRVHQLSTQWVSWHTLCCPHGLPARCMVLRPWEEELPGRPGAS